MNYSSDSDSYTAPISLKPTNDEWWSSIFKPNFTFTECQEILNLTTEAQSDSSLSLPTDDINSARALQEVADNIDKDDNVYRRVWRKNRFDDATKKCMSENNLTNHELFHTGYLCCDSSTQTDSCIWDSKELKIIRSCLKDFKHKNRKLDAQIKHLTLRNEELNAKNVLLEKRLEKKAYSLSEALKANDRFHILTDTLSNQLDETKYRNKGLIEQKSTIFDEQLITQNKIDELQRDILQKDNSIRKQKKKLDNVENHIKTIVEESLSTAEARYQKEINQLQTQLADVTKSLKNESYLHRATEKGFQQLLKHYSDQSPAVISPDIKSIKYVNMP